MKHIDVKVLFKTGMIVADDYNYYEISNFVREELKRTGIWIKDCSDVDVQIEERDEK